MNSSIKACLVIFCFLNLISETNSQVNYSSTINISGGTNTLGNFTLEWNVGESADITTMQSGNYMLTNGLLQFSTLGNQISPSLDDKLATESWLANEIKIYPNPFKTNLEIVFSNNQSGMVKMTIFDMNNHFIASKSFEHQGVTNSQKWGLNQLAAGQYILQIQQTNSISGKIIKNGTFKIIKLN